MAIQRKLSAREIIGTLDNMSARPEFYSGRGATSSDLDSRTLEKIYQRVKSEHGDDAAENFVRMVADIPVLSATDFLNTLYKLDSSGWEWNQRLLSGQRGIDVGPDKNDGRRGAIAYATVVNSVAGSGERNETSYIRGEFLRNHGITP